MPEKITILKESGETLVSNIVSIFTIPETEKRYIITTENAVDPHGLTVLHVSEIVDGNMQKVATDDEWSSIKTIMRAIISGNVGSYKYLPVINNLNAVSQYSRDISVSASASKQMIDNYNAGDKMPIGNEGGETLGVEQEQMPVTPSSIFPTNGSNASSDDEVVPGIAEVTAGPAEGAQPSIIPTPVVEPAPVGVAPEPIAQVPVNQMPVPPVGPVAPVVPTQPVIQPAPVVTAMPVTPEPEVITPLNNAVPTPVVPNPVVMPDNSLGNPEATAVNVAVTPVIDAQVNPPVGVSPVSVLPDQPSPIASGLGLTNDVQVAQPTVVIPDAQIVQNAQNTSLTTDEQINFNATPSFDPNATLDEVVVAAQQMFMEGVKNLVVTMQEKVYRDLYSKEEELKNREALIAQKEQALGLSGQVVQPGTPTQPVVNPTLGATPVSPAPLNSAPQPVVVQPTVVQASNDVI